jgi:hypothetical protein
MITLGEIKSINSDTNMCLVKLPTLEGAGNKNKIELHATMMLPPGIDTGYEVGDVVFVSFVDNSLGRPTVLGQLYRGPGNGTKIDSIGSTADDSLGCANTMTCKDFTSKNNAQCTNLKVTGYTEVPQSTKFTGAEDAYNTPADLIARIQSLEASLDRTQAALKVLALATAGGFLADFKYAAAAACCATGVALGLGEFAAEVIEEVKEETEEESSPENTEG